MTRVLHLFSNHKLTGPAELALDTALAIDHLERDDGTRHDVRFLSAAHGADPAWLDDLARQRSAPLVKVPGLVLKKHFNPFRSGRDAWLLSRYLRDESIDLIHCHLPNDHLVAAAARRLLGARARLPIVRTLYDGQAPAASWRQVWTLRRNCDRLLVFSQEVRDALAAGPLAIPVSRLLRVDPPIDTERFRPATAGERVRARESLELPADAFVAGIVARMQRHRRFEVLLRAVERVAKQLPGFRFVIVGRGTHQETVARRPVREMGLTDVVRFAGYIGGQQYVDALRCLDLKVFLVPGSDGTCRAVREALSAGIPVVCARRGMLGELVRDGVTGRVVDDTEENLALAILELARDRETLASMAQQSRRDALERFRYESHARAVTGEYDALLDAAGSAVPG